MSENKRYHKTYNMSISTTIVDKISTTKAVKTTKKMTVNNDTREKQTYCGIHRWQVGPTVLE